MNDVLSPLLILVAMVAGFGTWWWCINRVRHTADVLIGLGGTEYAFLIGDRLKYGYAVGLFSGIDITLPAVLPNIYLDGKVREGTLGPRHFFAADQRLRLEGDFDRYFNCYVPNGYQVLALSILTPDVMDTLRRTVPDCDVEIYRDHVRIIVNHKIYNRPPAVAKLLQAAQAVLGEIDHRLRSWGPEDGRAAAGTLLRADYQRTIKLFGGRFRAAYVWFAAFYGFAGALCWAGLLAAAPWPPHPTVGWFLRLFWILPVFFPGLGLFAVFATSVGWMGKLGRLIGKLVDHLPDPDRTV